MTPEKIVLYEVREEIEKLPEADRIRVDFYVSNLRQMLASSESHAAMAICLIAAELAAGA